MGTFKYNEGETVRVPKLNGLEDRVTVLEGSSGGGGGGGVTSGGNNVFTGSNVFASGTTFGGDNDFTTSVKIGTDTGVVTDPVGSRLNIGLGTEMPLDASFSPMVKLERAYSHIDNDVATAGMLDGRDLSAETSTLNSTAYGLDMCDIQVVGLYGAGYHSGENPAAGNGTSPDGCGVYGWGRIFGSGVGVGIGGYFCGQRDTATGLYSAVEAQAANYTVTATTYNATGFSSCGVWVSANGQADTAAGIIISNPFGWQFEYGLAFTAQVAGGKTGGIKNASIRDDSHSPTVLDINGQHTDVLDTQGATVSGKVIRMAAGQQAGWDDVALGRSAAGVMKVTNGAGGYGYLDTGGLGINGASVDDMFVLVSDVSDAAYGAGWDGSLQVPTKNAVYDAIQGLSTGGVTDGDKGQIVVSGGGTVWNLDTGAAVANLGFTPYNATNPAGYISSINSGMVTTALGYTPTSVTGLTGTQTVAAFKTGLGLVKGDVGLGSVDNTADATKNVLSATKLTTARTINGVSFDGTANITINAVDSTARLAASAVSAFGLTLIDDADAAAARATLGLGTLATQSGTFSGTNTGDETKASIDTKIGASGGTTNFYRQDGTWASPLSFTAGQQVGWSDVALTRAAAGVMKVTDGASGYGFLDTGGLGINGVSVDDMFVLTTGGTITGDVAIQRSTDVVANLTIGTTSTGYNGGSVTFIGAGGSNIAKMTATYTLANAGQFVWEVNPGGPTVQLGRWNNGEGLVSSTKIVVPDVAYGAGWDGDLSVPTKNAVYDKIQTLSAGADPWTTTALTSDYNNATTTFANITDGTRTLVFTPPANTNWELEARLIVLTTVATNLPRVRIAVQAGAAAGYGAANLWQGGATATASVHANVGWNNPASVVNQGIAAGGVLAANDPVLCEVIASGRSGATPTAISIQMAAETAAAATCYIKAGSFMKVRTGY